MRCSPASSGGSMLAQDAEPLAAVQPARRRQAALLDAVLLLAALIVLWQVGTLLLGRDALPSPLATAARLATIVNDADFPRHALETGRAFLTSLVISLVAGLALGLALGANRLAGEVSEPMLTALYSI